MQERREFVDHVAPMPRGLQKRPPESFVRAKEILAEALAMLKDPNVGGPIPNAGKQELMKEHDQLVADANGVLESRKSSWTFMSKTRRLEDRATNFKKAVEFSANVARLRVQAQASALRKKRSPSSSRSRSQTRASPSSVTVPQPAPQGYPDVLLPHEIYWCERYPFLLTSGYRLRGRYAPGWIPSFGPRSRGAGREDSLYYTSGSIMDATRISDGAPVMLKKVSKTRHPFEVQIGLMFTQRRSRKNHCVPIYEVLPDSEDKDLQIAVMPRLRVYDNPPFQNIGEVVEFLRQVFEGLAYMHKHHVVHRNMRLSNILLDPSQLYPLGYHPIEIDRSPDYGSPATHYTRAEHPPKYYIGTFKSSHRYSSSRKPPGGHGQGGFQDDVYDLGVSLREAFLRGNYTYERAGLVGFLTPLVNEMIYHATPPTAAEVVVRFDGLWRSADVSFLRTSILDDGKPGESGWKKLIRGLSLKGKEKKDDKTLSRRHTVEEQRNPVLPDRQYSFDARASTSVIQEHTGGGGDSGNRTYSRPRGRAQSLDTHARSQSVDYVYRSSPSQHQQQIYYSPQEQQFFYSSPPLPSAPPLDSLPPPPPPKQYVQANAPIYHPAQMPMWYQPPPVPSYYNTWQQQQPPPKSSKHRRRETYNGGLHER